MTTATKQPTAADLKAELDKRRARLEELEGELNAIPAAIEELRAKLGRSLSVGEADTIRKPLRREMEKLEARREELDAAVGILRPEVEALEAEWKPVHAAELEAEADRLEREARDAMREAWATFHRLAAEFAAVHDRATKAYNNHRAARAEALKAAGAHREDVFRAEGKLHGVPVGGVDGQAFAAWRQTAATVAAYGRAAKDRS